MVKSTLKMEEFTKQEGKSTTLFPLIVSHYLEHVETDTKTGKAFTYNAIINQSVITTDNVM